jgi:hypothetical protein
VNWYHAPSFNTWSGPNYLGKLEESRVLADQIADYWLAKGEIVRTWVEETKVPLGKLPVYTVRSDMVDGLPRKA